MTEDKPTRPEKLKNRKYAISYIRFSTKKQELGDSFERQLDATNKYCEDYELVLSEDNYNDLGTSAYKSFNLLPEAGLGFFLHKLERGEIKKPKETCLIIESLDRLSRAELSDSMPIFMNIIKKGIAIVTLSDSQIYIRDTKHADQTNQLLISLMMLSKAHAESLDKSYRIGKAWQKKKEKARKEARGKSEAIARNETNVSEVKALTTMCPSWLMVNDNNEYEKKSDYVEVIQRIFDLTTGDYTKDDEPSAYEQRESVFLLQKEKGLSKIKDKRKIEVDYLSLSSIEIVKLFNAESVPILKSGKRKKTEYWNTSNINKVLSNKVLTGVYQPKKLVQVEKERVNPLNGEKITVKVQAYENDGKPIKNFYPEIIKTNQFLKANLYKRAKLKGKRGRKGNKFANLLTNIAKCRSCGSNMIHNFKGISKKGKKWVYLQCSLAKSGGNCKYASVNYETVEYNLLRFMCSSEFSPVIGDKKSEQNEIDKLSKNIKEIDGRLEEIKDLYNVHMKYAVKGMEDFSKETMDELSVEKGSLEKLKLGYSDSLEFLVRNQLSETFDSKHFKKLIESISVDNLNLSDEQIYFNRLRVNGIIENLTKSVRIETEKKKLLILYKDGSGQVISIDKAFENNSDAELCINIPRFIFPEGIPSHPKQLLTEVTNNACMEVLNQCFKLKNEGKYSSLSRRKILDEKINHIKKYLFDTAKSYGYDFRFEKKEYTFYIG